MGVEFRLLGPVEVWAGGRVVDVGEPRRRAVLAALLLDAGVVVRSTTLVERVWGECPPAHAHRTLGTYITRIRRVLEQAGQGGQVAVSVIGRLGGYQLTIDRDQVDLHRFRHLVDQARVLDATDLNRVELLRQAVALWQGEPLTGVPGDWAARTSANLVRERLEAVAAWADSEVRTGQVSAVLAPLTELADQYPLMEPLTAALVRALAAAGRPTEALACCRTHRQRLADEYGTDQSQELQALYEAVLRGELDPKAAARLPMAAPVPAQLPADVAGFTGRAGHLAQLDALLPVPDEPPRSLAVAVVSGTAGVGKTALVVHWAHRVVDRFPDGQLYVNLRGFHPDGQAMEPAEAVRGFLDALDVPAHRIPRDGDAQAALYRSLLAGRRVLVVLDNARDTAQVRSLLPGAPSCLVLVTSRNRLAGLIATGGARSVSLDLPPAAEARALLAARLGSHRVDADPDGADELVRRCDRLPLALALVAAQAAIRPHTSLRALADELRDSRQRWHTLAADEPGTDLSTVLSWSYDALARPAARLFRLLGLHPGPDFTVAAAASLAALDLVPAWSLLTDLASCSLLVESIPGRYHMHDLLHAYANRLATAIDPQEQRDGAVHRVLDHYLHTAYAASQLLHPARDPIDLMPPRPGVSVEPFADDQHALAWFTAEHRVLLATIDNAGTDWPDHIWRLAWTLRPHLHRQGHWHQQIPVGLAAVTAADASADPAAQAIAHRDLGVAYIWLGRFDDARTHLGRALDSYRGTDDRAGQAHVHFNLGLLYERQGRPVDALDHATHALELYRAVRHRHGEANALSAVGWCHAQLGDHRPALAAGARALALFRRLGDRYGQAIAWSTLGLTHHQLGRYAQAVRCYQHTVALHQELGARYDEATALTDLGDVHRSAGRPRDAGTSWQRALAILDDLAHPEAAAVRSKMQDLGELATGQPDVSQGSCLLE